MGRKQESLFLLVRLNVKVREGAMDSTKNKVDGLDNPFGSGEVNPFGMAEVDIDSETARYRTITESWNPREVFGQIFEEMKANGFDDLDNAESQEALLDIGSKIIREKLQPEFILARRLTGLMLSQDSSIRDFAKVIVDHGISATALFVCASTLRGENNQRVDKEISNRMLSELKDSFANVGKQGGDKANEAYNKGRAKVYQWCVAHLAEYENNKDLDGAAHRMEREKIASVGWRTIRGYIIDYRKLSIEEIKTFIAKSGITE